MLFILLFQRQRQGQPPEMANQSMGPGGFPGRPQETNFDTDGRVETIGDAIRGPQPQRQESRQSSLPGSSVHDESIRRFVVCFKESNKAKKSITFILSKKLPSLSKVLKNNSHRHLVHLL